MKLLSDTSALLALLFPGDQHHRAAAAFARRSPKARFVMTELILAETVTRARALAGAQRAVGAADKFLASGRYELLFVDATLLRGALEKMSRFADKRLSLTDCTSFEVIDRLGLDGAFTFDRDFRDCGYRMLP